MSPTPATVLDPLNASQSKRCEGSGSGTIKYWVAAAVLFWFAVAFSASASGFFEPASGQPPLGFLVGIAVPVGLFILTYRLSGTFRTFIRGLDPVMLTLLQSWRVLGSVFMVLYLYNMMPGFFAYPAGLGDVAVGLSAPFVAMKVLKDNGYAKGRGFVVWNALGLFDFILAVVTGTLASGAFGSTFTGDGPTSVLMSSLPLAMIPGFIVPFYILLHFSALISVRARPN